MRTNMARSRMFSRLEVGALLDDFFKIMEGGKKEMEKIKEQRIGEREDWLGGDFNDEFKPLAEPDQKFYEELKEHAKGRLITGELDPDEKSTEDQDLAEIEIID